MGAWKEAKIKRNIFVNGKSNLCPNQGNCIPKWKILALNISGMNDVSKFTCKLSLNKIHSNIPKFHKQILECWFGFFQLNLH